MPKQDPSRVISAGDFLKAANRWNDFWMDEIGMYPLTFHNYLGMTSGIARCRNPNGTLHVRGSAAQKIEMLCGENWFAMLKIYQAQRGITRKPTALTKFMWK